MSRLPPCEESVRQSTGFPRGVLRCVHGPAACTTATLMVLVAAVAAVAAMTACGGAPDHPPTDTVAVTPEVRAAPPSTTAVPSDDRGRIALGGDIFNGRAAGGICFTCHGRNAIGTQLAPNLTDQTWINGDGSVEFIANTIRTGVPAPKQYPSAMPAFGSLLSDDQIRSVAAYVNSLSPGPQ